MSFFDKTLSEDDTKLLKKVKKEFFTNTVIKVVTDLEGNTFDGKTLQFGCKAGPGLDINNLFHEMGHFVEIDKKRMTENNWGLHCKTKIRIMGRFCNEFHTSQHIHRELRVAAYQYALNKHFNVDKTIEDIVSAFVYLDNFRLISGYKSDAESLIVAKKFVELYSLQFDIERFKYIWEDRINQLHKKTRKQK